MYSIISAETEEEHLKQFRKWIEKEWGTVNSFRGIVEGFTVPSPILAVGGLELLGGLGFTSFPKPGSKETGVWINSLLVAPAHRNMGIGSQLIQAAELEARRTKVKELYVYTDIPTLYQKHDWIIVDQENESTVLKRIVKLLQPT